MNSLLQPEDNVFKKRVLADFKYFIQSAIEKKISWSTLSSILTELPTTLDKSKEVIKILVQEFEKWIAEVENGKNVIQALNDTNDSNDHFQGDVTNQEDLEMPCSYDEKIVDNDFIEKAELHSKYQAQSDQMRLVNLETSDSEDESIESVIENTNSSLNTSTCDIFQNQDLIQFEKNGKIEEDIQLDAKIMLDKIGNQFYEFIGDNQDDKELSKESEEEEWKDLDKVSELDVSNVTEEIKEFKCTFCSKVFSKKDKLKRHIKIHTSSDNYKCNICNKTFHRIEGWKLHERIHSGEKPFQCKTCAKCFNDQSHLKKHEKIHTSKKPFQCTRCNKCFENLEEMKRHEAMHNKERAFQCSKCNKSYRRPSELKDHERSHTGEKPFQCEICKICFVSSSNLRIHHKKFHNNDL